jgi:hypothetical protein
MSSSFRIRRILGIDVNVHWTFLLLLIFFAFLGYWFAQSLTGPDLRRRDLALFVCVSFSTPLCQAALREGACESAMRLLKTASEMRLSRHRNASLRDLPSAIFLR